MIDDIGCSPRHQCPQCEFQLVIIDAADAKELALSHDIDIVCVMTYKRVFVIKCISSTGHQTYTVVKMAARFTHQAISSILHYRAGGPVNKA